MRFKPHDLVKFDSGLYAYILEIRDRTYHYIILNQDLKYCTYYFYPIEIFDNESKQKKLVEQTNEIKEKLCDLVLSII